METGQGIVRLAKIEKKVIDAFYVSKIAGDRAEILVFGVEDSRRHLGVAQLLLSRLLETLKEEKINCVSIKLNRRMAPLIKLFRRAGFTLGSLEKSKEDEIGFVLTKGC